MSMRVNGILMLVGLGIACLLPSCVGGDASPKSPETSTAITPSPKLPIPVAPAATNKVAIDNFVFKPDSLTVPVGATVTWVNQDDVPHTVTASLKPRAFDSGSLDTDQQFSFTFKTPGTYTYFCAVHPHMTGKIVVVGGQ